MTDPLIYSAKAVPVDNLPGQYFKVKKFAKFCLCMVPCVAFMAFGVYLLFYNAG